MYRHHWSYAPSDDRYASAWPTILTDTRSLIGAVQSAGIRITGPTAPALRCCRPKTGSRSTADAGADLGGDTSRMSPPGRRNGLRERVVTAFCDTARKPYDVCVAAVLLRCLLLLPDAFGVSSDGGGDAEWLHGAARWRAPQLSPRRLVATLFTVAAPVNPLGRGWHLPNEQRRTSPPGR